MDKREKRVGKEKKNTHIISIGWRRVESVNELVFSRRCRVSGEVRGDTITTEEG